MLHNVPAGINTMARNVIINHPNAFNFELYRRALLRPAPEVGGQPTLGGMMVLSSEDEEAISWAFIGLGYALSAEAFAPASMVDRRDATYGGLDELRFLLEPEAMLGDAGGFAIEKGDVIYLLLGAGEGVAKVAYELVGVESTLNMAPYVSRYITNRRADLDVLPSVAD
ncbi:MAG: hypothetical protein ACRCYV_03545 [Aeromonas sp.]